METSLLIYDIKRMLHAYNERMWVLVAHLSCFANRDLNKHREFHSQSVFSFSFSRKGVLLEQQENLFLYPFYWYFCGMEVGSGWVALLLLQKKLSQFVGECSCKYFSCLPLIHRQRRGMKIFSNLAWYFGAGFRAK